MSRTRLVLALLLGAAGIGIWIVTGFQMMLTAAYGAWGLAFLFCMGTGLGTALCYAAWRLFTWRDPLVDHVQARAAGAPPPAPRAQVPRPPRD